MSEAETDELTLLCAENGITIYDETAEVKENQEESDKNEETKHQDGSYVSPSRKRRDEIEAAAHDRSKRLGDWLDGDLDAENDKIGFEDEVIARVSIMNSLNALIDHHHA